MDTLTAAQQKRLEQEETEADGQGAAKSWEDRKLCLSASASGTSEPD